jgi:ERCC4-type nuclease
LSSIKDGRYEEQSYRLNGLDHHNHNIIYLIEGDVNRLNPFKSNYHVEKLMAYSAMFSLNYYKGFSVFRSINMEETATIICNMAYKLEKDANNSAKQPYYTNAKPSANAGADAKPSTDAGADAKPSANVGANAAPSTDAHDGDTSNVVTNIEEQSFIHCEIKDTEKDYVSVVKKVKKENITPGNIGEIMLCQIPGISSITALAIMEKYGTLSNLMKELDTNPECLNGICYTNTKGQSRKINKTSVENIVKFLLHK